MNSVLNPLKEIWDEKSFLEWGIYVGAIHESPLHIYPTIMNRPALILTPIS